METQLPVFPVFLLLISILLLAAVRQCPKGEGIVEITVLRGPIEPVCTEGEPCDEPFSATFQINEKIGDLPVTTVQSDAEGFFSISLTPGTYTLIPDENAPILLPARQTKEFVVEEDVVKQYTFTFDTGIRSTSTSREPQPDLPQSFELSDAYPNPFNPTTTFTLKVAKAQHVGVEVLDVKGHRIVSLHDGSLTGGHSHAFTIKGDQLPSGTYYYRAVGEYFFSPTRSVVLVK